MRSILALIAALPLLAFALDPVFDLELPAPTEYADGTPLILEELDHYEVMASIDGEVIGSLVDVAVTGPITEHTQRYTIPDGATVCFQHRAVDDFDNVAEWSEITEQSCVTLQRPAPGQAPPTRVIRFRFTSS